MGVTASGDHQATHGTHAKLMVCSADASASRRSCCSAVAFLATHQASCAGSRRRAARLVVRMPAVSWTASEMLGGGRRCCSVCSAALILSMLRSQRLHDERVRMASLLPSARAARNHALRPDPLSSWPSTSVDFGRLGRQCQRWRPTFCFVYAERDDAHLYILCLGLWGLVLMSWYVMYHT